MEKLTYDEVKQRKGFLSDDLREQVPEIKDGVYVNFAFTDYGGNFFDKVCIAYFQVKYPNSCLWEETSYYGQNAILWGDVAKDFLKEYDIDPLGYEDLEEFYSTMEFEEKTKYVENFVYDILCSDLDINKDNIKASNKQRIYDALWDNTELDHGVNFYCSIEDAIEALNLGAPKFTCDWEAVDKRIGQGRFDF